MLRDAHAWPIIDLVLKASSALIGGRYVVGEPFGSGGMGTVHLGRVVGAGGFSRVVAVKKLFPGLATDKGFRQMLLDEARLAARIRHPNVVPTLDVVEAGTDLYIVMEYVHGLSLAEALDRCAGEPVPVDVALGIVQGFLLGLQAAHDARGEDGAPLGIVHRDVSPQNVLVGADGVARLIDFGIAKAATRIHVTDPGVLKGKAAYMAPEQLVQEPVSRQADVFSSAAVLWELLAGRPLFPDADLVSRVNGLHDAPRPPSAHRAGLDPALDEVVLRGLAREPSRRFPTAEAMAVALARAGAAASSVEIGRWLTAHAADDIDLSDERVRLFEKSTQDEAAAVPVVTAAGPEPTRRRGVPLWMVLVGVPAAIVLGGVALRLALARDATSAAAPASAAAALATPAASPAPAEAPSAPASVAATAPATVSSVASPVPASSSRTRPARTRGPAKRNCDPPYTVDSTGFKHYDPACF